MKRKILSSMAAALALTAFAQTTEYENSVILDWAEDTTQITTVNDIINLQERVTARNSSAAHFSKVWSRNTFCNISYSSMKLTPKEEIPLGIDFNNGYAPEFKSDWGAAIQIGHNYGLHRKPIANMVKINLDAIFFDLNVNHFKAEDATYLYNSANKWGGIVEGESDPNPYQYTPWCLQKYEANYTMGLGPSITITPFSYINVPQLHFFKINVYYHIGYQVAFLWMQNNDKKDANTGIEDSSAKNEMDYALKLDWTHGLTTAFGFNVSWKTIGIGYETRSSKYEYKAMQTGLFGKDKYKFDATSSRIYIQFKY